VGLDTDLPHLQLKNYEAFIVIALDSKKKSMSSTIHGSENIHRNSPGENAEAENAVLA